MNRLNVFPFLLSALLVMPLAAHAGEEEFYGLIESLPEGKIGTWIIGGREVEVTRATELEEDEGPFVVGACVEVEYKRGVVDEIETEKMYKCLKPGP